MKTEEVTETKIEATKAPKVKPPIIPTPNRDITGRKPTVVSFRVHKDCLRKFEVPSADARRKADVIYHIYPTLGEWMGRILPDGVNPRSHDPECLKGKVAKDIEQTILDKPENFHLANRGSTIIAESVSYDPKNQTCEITITDAENQGLADGATTDAVLAKVQTELARTSLEKKDADYATFFKGLQATGNAYENLPEVLKSGRIHLEVWTGLTDRTRIADLVEGRNTSRQVRGWSMADFRQEYDWLKNILEDDKSEFKGKVGYEENSGKDVTVLDVLSILTLFHPEFDSKDAGGDRAPVVAYANKGRMDTRLQDDKIREGYKNLSPLIPDILKLHDYVYAKFDQAYEAGRPKARLGRRQGVTSYVNEPKPYRLELTGMESLFKIPSGFIFPLLASLRALVVYKGNQVGWKVDPFAFFDKYGSVLVSELMEQVESQGGNPNVAGKRKTVYTAIHAQARIALNDELEEKRSKSK